ncbi:hypothetical protein [Chthonobacter albigriseus]|nr:hypothetical protein [Chthonobacter albigriseus]
MTKASMLDIQVAIDLVETDHRSGQPKAQMLPCPGACFAGR